MRRTSPSIAVILVAALAHAGIAGAQALRVCAGQGGTTAYRDGACLPGERLLALREADPGPRPPLAATRDAVRAAAAGANAPPGRRGPGRRREGTARRQSRRTSPPDACAAARAARDDFQRRRGIAVTMAQLSRWNHRVYDACK